MIWVPFHVKMRNCQKHDFSTQMSDFNILPAEFSNDSRVLLRLEAILSRLWSIAELGFEAEVVEVATRPICSSFCPGKLANLKIFGAEFWSGLFVFRVFSPFEGLKGMSCLRKRALERENKKYYHFFRQNIYIFFLLRAQLTLLGFCEKLSQKRPCRGDRLQREPPWCYVGQKTYFGVPICTDSNTKSPKKMKKKFREIT